MFDEFDDIELINDLNLTTPSDTYSLASPSDALPVTLETIHGDIQLLIVTILMIYTVLFVVFISKRWK